MPTIYWYGSCPLLRNLKIEELWELNQDQKGLQNPQENQTGVNETIKKRQVTHRPSNLIITKGGLRIGHWIFCPVAYSFYKQRSVVSIYFFMKTVYFSFLSYI